jgi:hypothetical protein
MIEVKANKYNEKAPAEVSTLIIGNLEQLETEGATIILRLLEELSAKGVSPKYLKSITHVAVNYVDIICKIDKAIQKEGKSECTQ